MDSNSVIETLVMVGSDLLGFELDYLRNSGNTVIKKAVIAIIIFKLT